MRVGFRVTTGNEPLEGASIQASIPGLLTAGWPLPVVPVKLVTDANGEAFGVAPLALGPANYLLDVAVAPPAGPKGLKAVRIAGVFDEVENLFTTDLATGTWVCEKLPERIAGDGWNTVDVRPLRLEDILVLPEDPMLSVSNCGLCAYLFPVLSGQGTCIVNLAKGPHFGILNSRVTTCRLYSPWFLLPSPTKLIRDLGRMPPPPPPPPPILPFLGTPLPGPL